MLLANTTHLSVRNLSYNYIYRQNLFFNLAIEFGEEHSGVAFYRNLLIYKLVDVD